MTHCHHLYGHTSPAHTELCFALVAARPHIRAFSPRADLDGPRFAVRGHEAMTRGDDAEMTAAARDLRAFVARAKGEA